MLLCATNRLEIIAIRCYPWTVFDLLGLPSGKEGAHIFTHPIARLHAALDRQVKAGRIEVRQDGVFGQIWLRRATPRSVG